jgi:nicotinamidase/pyrazinamidase
MKCLLIVDLQKDFVYPDGALYTEGVEKIVPEVLKLIREFKSQNLPIITTADTHVENDKEFNIWPPHCIKNTEGWKIIPEVENELKNYKLRYHTEKSRYSAFYNSNFEEILKEIGADEFHVAGLVSNICVLFTVEDLKSRWYDVYVHEKATDSYDKELHKLAMREMKEVLGAEVV